MLQKNSTKLQKICLFNSHKTNVRTTTPLYRAFDYVARVLLKFLFFPSHKYVKKKKKEKKVVGLKITFSSVANFFFFSRICVQNRSIKSFIWSHAGGRGIVINWCLMRLPRSLKHRLDLIDSLPIRSADLLTRAERVWFYLLTCADTEQGEELCLFTCKCMVAWWTRVCLPANILDSCLSVHWMIREHVCIYIYIHNVLQLHVHTQASYLSVCLYICPFTYVYVWLYTHKNGHWSFLNKENQSPKTFILIMTNNKSNIKAKLINY